MLIDTSGFLCVLDNRDRRHQDAFAIYRSAATRLTHNYVIAELIPLAITRKFSRARTLEFLVELMNDPQITIIWTDDLMTEKALRLLSERNDKSWSLCDAVRFVLMDEFGLTDALTTDHHFEQAGFVRLLTS